MGLELDVGGKMGRQALFLGEMPGSLALAPELAWRALALLPWPSTFSFLSPEPDNEAHIRSSSRPCSPVHHHEGHTKVSSSPPRASPVRMGPSYVLKKGSGE